MRESVSRQHSCRSMHKRVCDIKPSLRESSWAVRGLKTFFKNNIFLEAHSHLSSECLKRTHRLLSKHRMHMHRVYGHRRWLRPPRQVSAGVGMDVGVGAGAGVGVGVGAGVCVCVGVSVGAVAFPLSLARMPDLSLSHSPFFSLLPFLSIWLLSPPSSFSCPPPPPLSSLYANPIVKKNDYDEKKSLYCTARIVCHKHRTFALNFSWFDPSHTDVHQHEFFSCPYVPSLIPMRTFSLSLVPTPLLALSRPPSLPSHFSSFFTTKQTAVKEEEYLSDWIHKENNRGRANRRERIHACMDMWGLIGIW